MAPAKTQAPPTLTLADKIRHAADSVRAADKEVKSAIDAWLDSEKSSQAGAGLPRESLRQMLMSRWHEPWYAVIHLESQLAHE
jgi:hypothetical protein